MPDLSRGVLWEKTLLFARTAGTDFARNNGSYMASSIAYWMLFSMFPLAIAGMSILGYLYATPEDLYRSPQLHSRQFFQEIDHPKAGTLAFPVRPYTTSNGSGDAPTGQTEPAPLLGQHNEEIFCGRLGLRPEQLSNLRRGGAV